MASASDGLATPTSRDQAGHSNGHAPGPQRGLDVRRRFIYEDDAALERPLNWAQLRRLLAYMLPYRRVVALAMAVMLLGAVARLTVPYLISLAIDRAIRPGDIRLLYLLAAGILACYTVGWWAHGQRIRITNWIGQHVLYDIRQGLFSHIQYLSFNFFDRRPAGSILVRIINDVNALQDLFTTGVISVLMDILTISGIVIILFNLHPRLAIASMVVLPLMFILSTRVRREIRRAWREVRLRSSRLNAHLAEAIQGMKVTEAFVQEKENLAFFDHMNDDYRQSWNRSSRIADLFNPLVELTGAIGTCIVYWYGANLVRSGELTVGLLVGFANYLGNFWEPISRLGQVYSQLLVAMASSERIFEFLDTQPTVAEKPSAQPLPPIRGEVRFEQVTFEYAPGRPALHDFDLYVAPGETVALVGPTGSGKTTVVNLLCRFYDVTRGRVLIDGQDVREVQLASLRSQIGIVLQDTFLFSGTLLDNIRFGRLDATEDEVVAAARAVGAHTFIEKLPQGYRTEVAERGGGLSLGQRQLISFARALLADPRILILDEATASIDTETELLIQQALERLLAGRTAFVVAHRLSTIRNADKIVVLQHGRIVEMGNHQQLMAKRGAYFNLVQAQFRFLRPA